MKKYEAAKIYFLGIISAFLLYLFISNSSLIAFEDPGPMDNDVGRFQFYVHPNIKNKYGVIDTKSGTLIRVGGEDHTRIKEVVLSAVYADITFDYKLSTLNSDSLTERQMQRIFRKFNEIRQQLGYYPIPDEERYKGAKDPL